MHQAGCVRTLIRAEVLILDDFGLQVLDASARHDLLELVEERYGRRSTIIASQPPVEKWHDLIGDPTYADAILDRIVHNAHRIELKGESMRKERAHRKEGAGANAAAASRKGKADESGGKQAERAAKED